MRSPRKSMEKLVSGVPRGSFLGPVPFLIFYKRSRDRFEVQIQDFLLLNVQSDFCLLETDYAVYGQFSQKC